MASLDLSIQPEAEGDAAAIEDLHDRAFGPGRYARSAERVREWAGHDPAMSFVARVSTLLVGSVRQTPMRVGDIPGLMLGPLAVEPAFMGRGIGRMLLERSLSAATASPYRLVLLVGDEPYYKRVGFRRVPPGQILMPGPVDPGRVLVWTVDEETFAAAKGPIQPA